MTDENHCNHSFVVPRRGLPQVNGRLTEKGTVTVAFLGGSITEGQVLPKQTHIAGEHSLVSIFRSGLRIRSSASSTREWGDELNFRCSSITGACPAAGHN